MSIAVLSVCVFTGSWIAKHAIDFKRAHWG